MTAGPIQFADFRQILAHSSGKLTGAPLCSFPGGSRRIRSAAIRPVGRITFKSADDARPAGQLFHWLAGTQELPQASSPSSARAIEADLSDHALPLPGLIRPADSEPDAPIRFGEKPFGRQTVAQPERRSECLQLSKAQRMAQTSRASMRGCQSPRLAQNRTCGLARRRPAEVPLR